ncbi:peptidase [Haloarcula litorea]|uniref:peptidase n=1 Tax=Haloarcula litorea TaxID=3032579 RepID=UPI0023E829AB|nr:peptidase [Halomicroarcula sp. GDY20]
MRVGHRGWAVVVCAVLLVLSPVAPALGAAAAVGATTGESDVEAAEPSVRRATLAAVGDAPTAQLADEDTIRQTQRYSLTPETPGEVAVTLRYEIPDRVVSLETTMPDNATVTDADGFARANDTTYEWDGTSGTATIDLTLPTNRSIDGRFDHGNGSYVTVDAGEWALISRAQTPTRWRYTGSPPVRFSQDLTTVGPGAAGDQLVYLGNVTTYERDASGQRLRLVVPERTELAESPDAVLDSLSAAGESLRIGDRDDAVFVVAAPTGDVDWAVKGLETGGSDMWVRGDARLDDPRNVWLHEYVHTRQSFRTTAETRWLTEATAVYYAALLTLEQDRIDFETFRSYLAEGSQQAYDDVVLAEPATWRRNANYVKGPLVAGRIDEATRRETDREATFQGTLRVLNGQRGPVTQSEFLTAVERTAGDDVRASAGEYTTTSEAVTMWNETTHARVFGQLPARISYALPTDGSPGSYRVAGPYRRTDVAGTPPLRLATGETLTVEAVVTNAGGTAGSYNATLDINGTVVATKQGRVGPGNRTVVPLSHTFATPGVYNVSVDGDHALVVVERPARARVTDVSVSSDSVVQGGGVVVTATVVNDADVPAEGTVVFTRDYQAVATREVTLPPRTTATVSSGVAVPEPGTVLVSAGGVEPVLVSVTPANDTTTVTATRTTATGTETGTTAADGAGFTAAAAVVALLFATLLARRDRR